MSVTSQELTVTHPATGEILDLAAQDTESLVNLITGAQDLHSLLGQFEREVGAEIVRRLDHSAVWTLRIGDIEVKAPSPTAGTEAYPPDMLEGELAKLIAEGIISTDAASKACHRRVTIEVAVPWSANHHTIAKQVKDAASIMIADVPVEVLRADTRTSSVQAGINALRKIPGTASALDRARVTQPAPPRKPTVKRRLP